VSRRAPVLLGAGAVVAAIAVALTLVVRATNAGSEGWGVPVPAPAARASGASTAVTADGTVLAAWTERRRGLTSVVASERPAGGKWSVPVAIQEPQPFGVRGPSLAIDEAGTAVVTFGLWSRGQEVLMAAYRPAGGNWETPQALAPVAGGFYDAAAAVGDGVTVVTWAQPFVTTGRLAATIRGTGTAWTDGVPIGPTQREHRQQRLAVTPGGGVVVATAGYRASRLAVLVRPPRGTWIRLPHPPAPGGPDLDVAVAGDRSGRPVIAWTRVTAGGGAALWTSTFEDGAWTTPRRLDQGPRSSWFGPLTAATTRDGVVVAWTRWQREWTRVVVRAAAADGPARTLDEFGIPDIRGPAGTTTSAGPPPTRVVLGAGDDPVAMWDRLVQRDPAPASELVVVRARGESWETPEPVHDEPVSGWPLAVGATGDGTVATWAEYASPDRGGLRVVAAERPGRPNR
jgi:hypothetical protein